MVSLPLCSLLASLAAAQVSIPFSRSALRQHSSGLNKRETKDVNLTAYNSAEQVAYLAVLSIGTPAQNVTALIDTGSSDLWVFSGEEYDCTSNDEEDPETQDTCYGIFDPDDSKTFKANTTGLFEIVYGKGEAMGYFGQDTISIGGATLKNSRFGVVNDSEEIDINVFGIGLESLETTVEIGDYEYTSIPYQLKESGAIDRVAYSLWLNDDYASGQLLFGAVDTAKFDGNLTLLPFIPVMDSEATRTTVMVNGISLSNGHNHSQIISNLSWPFLLDSGTTLTILPVEFLKPIIKTLGAVYDSEVEGYVMSYDGCSNVSGSIGFNVSGFNFEVPLEDFVVEYEDDYDDDVTYCMLGVSEGELESVILGDNVLRRLYAVFDLESKEVGLAYAKHNVTEVSIEPISKSIPSATHASHYNSTQLDWRYSTTVATSLFTARSKYFSSLTASATGSYTFDTDTLLFPTSTGEGEFTISRPTATDLNV